MGATMNRLDRPWDSFDAYLFDIDGTLINCTDATHYFAFCDVLKTISGRELTLPTGPMVRCSPRGAQQEGARLIHGGELSVATLRTHVADGMMPISKEFTGQWRESGMDSEQEIMVF